MTIDSVIELKPHGEFSRLPVLHYSLHSVLYDGKVYPTALHLFEARKFLPNRRDLAKRVRQRAGRAGPFDQRGAGRLRTAGLGQN